MSEKNLRNNIDNAWQVITPFWPLKNLVSTNPLFGFIDKPFNEAMTKSLRAVGSRQLSESVRMMNQKTIQWCQLFFDQGQATIQMPYKELGLYSAVLKLIEHEQQDQLLQELPDNSYQAVQKLVDLLQICESDQVQLFKTLLLSLSGWSSHVCYQADWNSDQTMDYVKVDYLALRLLYMHLYNVSVTELLSIHKGNTVGHHMQTIQQHEEQYQKSFLPHFKSSIQASNIKSKVQFLLCIDVRSEPMRQALEQVGSYQTFGVAGFFNLPVRLQDQLLSKSYDACPVFVKPMHTIQNQLLCNSQECMVYQEKQISFNMIFDTVYKSLKYTFTAPFALVEILGPWSLVWMLLRTVSPSFAMKLKRKFGHQEAMKDCTWPELEQDQLGNGMSVQDQVTYAKQLLTTIGLIKSDSFAELVVITSHMSMTTNNAVGSLLDCGACGGNSGLANAKVLATILNNKEVRQKLAQENIVIPDSTYFIAAEHNTTTHQVSLYDNQMFKKVSAELKKELDQTLQQVAHHLQQKFLPNPVKRASDWSELLPEWGAAKNAAFVIGPREITKAIDLQGRVFLHSYEHALDVEGKLLETILAGPLVVAHWINSQYLFSTLDPVLYGSGSKVTQNVVGKLGVMQGNMSDLMTGLSIQSVNQSVDQAYHEPIRLHVVIYAERAVIVSIVQKHQVLSNLCRNGWIHLFAHDPQSNELYQLDQNLSWKLYQ